MSNVLEIILAVWKVAQADKGPKEVKHEMTSIVGTSIKEININVAYI